MNHSLPPHPLPILFIIFPYLVRFESRPWSPGTAGVLCCLRDRGVGCGDSLAIGNVIMRTDLSLCINLLANGYAEAIGQGAQKSGLQPGSNPALVAVIKPTVPSVPSHAEGRDCVGAYDFLEVVVFSPLPNPLSPRWPLTVGLIPIPSAALRTRSSLG